MSITPKPEWLEPYKEGRNWRYNLKDMKVGEQMRVHYEGLSPHIYRSRVVSAVNYARSMNILPYSAVFTTQARTNYLLVERTK